MQMFQQLKRDHRFFLEKLDELELWLDLSPPWEEMRDVAERLGDRLTDHIDRERALFVQYCPVIGPRELDRAMADHQQAGHLLGMVNQHVLGLVSCSTERVRPIWSAMIVVLRQGIQHQETSLFPSVSAGLALLALLHTPELSRQSPCESLHAPVVDAFGAPL